jgi:hypothetical protein
MPHENRANVPKVRRQLQFRYNTVVPAHFMITGPCRQRLPLTVVYKGAGGLTCLDWPFRSCHPRRHRHHRPSSASNLTVSLSWTPADFMLANMLIAGVVENV